MMRTAPEKREPKEEVLRRYVESSRRILSGMHTGGLAEHGELAHKLVRLGRLSDEEARRLGQRLERQLKRQQQLFQSELSRAMQGVVQRLQGVITPELSGLQERLSRLERGKRPPELSQPI